MEASSDFAPAAWAVLRDEQCELYAADGNLVGRLLAEPAPTLVPSPGRKGFMSGWSALECLEWELADTLAELQRVPVDQIEIDEELRSYGLDSISLVEFCGVAGERLGISLLPDVCYSHPTLQRLAAHLMSKDSETLARRYEEQTRVPQTVPTFAENASAPEEPSPLASENHEAPHSSDNQEPVYVVGMAGRFPGAGDVLGLWSVLCGGESVVGDVSGLRPGWGDGRRRVMGALDGIDEFDARFFNISPREAELMDPRQRLLLQEMWHALEDAGLSSADLTDKRIGVYVGAEDSGYLSRLEADTPITANHSGVLASRLSYFLDLRGPVLAINTACSSGLVALHEAWLSLRAGECDVAVVAGAHVITHPGAFDAMADAGMLSGSGCCSAFGAAADGMVPGEAVAVVVLQRGGVPGRSYGSVVASGVNYDGRTNGITAPSGSAQVDLLSGVYGVGGVDPGSVSHVMAHGTGTRLGDPVEVNALGVVFGGGVPVALSSVKSCLGHTQAASGLVSLIAVLLEMRFGVLVPSLNVGELNPFVAWDELGLEVVDRCREWGDVGGVLRRAGVSSFGISGTNAHVVVEAPAPDVAVGTRPGPHLLVLSADTPEALDRQVEAWSRWVADQPNELLPDLAHVSRTLTVGRQHLPERWATVVESWDETRDVLAAASSETRLRSVARGSVTRDFRPRSTMAGQLEDLARQLCRSEAENPRDCLETLGEAFCNGYTNAFCALWEGTNLPVVTLPGYVFEPGRYWVEPAATVAEKATKLHPLVHENTSDFWSLRFTSRFCGGESFLRDHRIAGRPTLPAAAQLAMVECAMRLANPEFGTDSTVVLQDFGFIRPVVVETPSELSIRLRPVGDGADVSIVSPAEPDIVHSSGHARVLPGTTSKRLDLAALRATYTHVVDVDDMYAQFERMGLSYGPAHRAVSSIAVGEDGALVELVASTAEEFGDTIHPGLLDGAFQAVLSVANVNDETRWLPMAVDKVCAHCAIPERAVAIVRPRGGNAAMWRRFDIDIADETGRVCVEIVGLTSSESQEDNQASARMFLAAHRWEPTAAAPVASAKRRTLTLLAGRLATRPVPGNEPLAGGDFRSAADALLTRLQQELRGLREPLSLTLVTHSDDHLSGLSGMLRTGALEQPLLRPRLIEVDEVAVEELDRLLDAERSSSEPHVRYADGTRLVPVWEEYVPNETPNWHPGTYLVTGGMGGLGRLIAADVLRSPGTCVVALGRAARDARIDGILDELAEPGRGHYRSVDVTDLSAVKAVVEEFSEDLTGVIHAAGVISDDYLLRKDPADLARVLDPKTVGAINLDLATADVSLRYFVCFGSVSGVRGNVGQGDYAAANAFLDEFSNVRAAQVSAGLRNGHSLTVDWSIWADGGMRIADKQLDSMAATWGWAPIPSGSGLQALRAAVAAPSAQILAFAVRPGTTFSDAMAAVRSESPAETTELPRETKNTAEQVMPHLQEVIVEVLKTPVEWLDPAAPLERLGMDSISILKITELLEQRYGTLPKTMFFEYTTLGEVASHLATLQPTAAPLAPAAHPQPAQEPDPWTVPERRDHEIAPTTPATGAYDIAIIGLAGRYPGARDVDEFWRNLAAGRDSVGEVPTTRWSPETYAWDPEGNGSYMRWGGFLDEVEAFDPLFFNISPREAATMDPQERQFLQCAYHAIQDAGYVPEELDSAQGRATGVYVGVTWNEYQLHAAQEQARGNPVSVNGNLASVANRVSYHLNLGGPSMAVDTLCSSSLTAIELACTALRTGSIDVAVAGGVNLSLHPAKYLALSSTKFGSTKGRCESFGAGGDGYVPGEGVGAVILKPLAKALADGDAIRGVIKSVAINHGGRTNGYTVPSPVAQSEAILTAVERAEIDPRAVGYIEAHGTGTRLGDPVEVRGLIRAFPDAPKGSIALGSVKSNIGHCEAAAGIAGLTKVLLQLQHRTLVPSLHSEPTNPLINFDETPFAVQRELTPWSSTESGSRVAGLSSFGAGGSNAHLIIQEFTMSPRTSTSHAATAVLLSARSSEQLLASADALLGKTSDLGDEDLPRVSFTLQTGREHFNHRLCIRAASMEDLREGLRGFLADPDSDENLRATLPRHHKPALTGVPGDIDSLVAAWLDGALVDWRSEYQDGYPSRISLPGYPFAREPYWMFDLPRFGTEPSPEPTPAQNPEIELEPSQALTEQQPSVAPAEDLDT
ncbi:SDR family NAD(P)-dependent oxidoreductase, partial [Arachnia propionica]|uniref:SDR family NAD(P)-dependent oxidoreductase n=2 Tax=Arachnia propionica TaxID=1750 RepID=UPI0013520A2A